jgi:hypothetical protein
MEGQKNEKSGDWKEEDRTEKIRKRKNTRFNVLAGGDYKDYCPHGVLRHVVW